MAGIIVVAIHAAVRVVDHDESHAIVHSSVNVVWRLTDNGLAGQTKLVAAR